MEPTHRRLGHNHARYERTPDDVLRRHDEPIIEYRQANAPAENEHTPDHRRSQRPDDMVRVMNQQTKAAAAPGFEERLASHETMVLAWRSVASRDSANPGRHPCTAPLRHELAVDIRSIRTTR